MEILPIYFFSALLIGFFIMYILFPKPKVVLKMPTPQNAGGTTYKDTNGVCYRYKKVEVDCDYE